MTSIIIINIQKAFIKMLWFLPNMKLYSCLIFMRVNHRIRFSEDHIFTRSTGYDQTIVAKCIRDFDGQYDFNVFS